MSEQPFNDFEEFWGHFLSQHRHPATRWIHVAIVVVGVHGTLRAARKGSLAPILKAAATASVMAAFAHRVFEGGPPERKGGRHPLWSGRAFARLVVRTVTGRVKEEVANLPVTA